jgi:tetratricopeptide (TPR) repeat protein
MRRSFTGFFLAIAFLIASSCYRVPDKIDPRISYQIQDQHFARLSSAFPPLSPAEKGSDWGKEYIIGRAFAEELDLYRAVSTFKRAAILLPEGDLSRKLEIQYDILLCFFLGKRYDEAIESFDKSDLSRVDKSFPAYHDLLLVLYECYREMDDPEKQQRIYELMEKSYPDTAEKIRLSRAIREGDLAQVDCFAQGFKQDSYLDDLLNCYWSEKKSVATAQFLNAILPGAGYLYIGQRKSAFTAFLLNGLFIAAAVQFFRHRHVAAGVITTGFEAGWYFGGIYGAGEEAKFYNERLYERNASHVLNERHLFPSLMMKYEF